MVHCARHSLHCFWSYTPKSGGESLIKLPFSLKLQLLIIDIGLLIYWLSVGLRAIPPEYAYRNASDPFMMAWNWSFFPLDILAALTGLYSLYSATQYASTFLILSLTMTFVAGLNAIAFWAIAGDFSIEWWLPNLYLMVVPLAILSWLLRHRRLIEEDINEE